LIIFEVEDLTWQGNVTKKKKCLLNSTSAKENSYFTYHQETHLWTEKPINCVSIETRGMEGLKVRVNFVDDDG
jgi:hypothetical protein